MCKGSTADSDSVCLGSNPGTAAKSLGLREPRLFYEVWLSLVERYVRDVEVAGSNPVTSTKQHIAAPNSRTSLLWGRRIFLSRRGAGLLVSFMAEGSRQFEVAVTCGSVSVSTGRWESPS